MIFVFRYKFFTTIETNSKTIIFIIIPTTFRTSKCILFKKKNPHFTPPIYHVVPQLLHLWVLPILLLARPKSPVDIIRLTVPIFAVFVLPQLGQRATRERSSKIALPLAILASIISFFCLMISSACSNKYWSRFGDFLITSSIKASSPSPSRHRKLSMYSLGMGFRGK